MRTHTQLSTKTYSWLITGVAGFIGSNLLETLLKQNQKVIGIDNFYTGTVHNLQQALAHVSPLQQQNFTFVEGDIRHQITCDKVSQSVDFVLHQAALSSIPKSVEQTRLTHEINIDGFYNMLEAARHQQVKRFIYASSCAVYGNAKQLPSQENQLVHILSPYSATKYMNEIYAKTFSACYGLETVGLRYFNIYGPRQEASSPYAAVIIRWIHELIQHKPTYIHDEHQQSRDFCYVEDVVDANILAATTTNPAAINTVYNIATGEESLLSQVYALLLKALNIKSQTPISQKTAQGELLHSRADISKARELLGFEPKFNIEQGISKIVGLILQETC